MLTSAAQTVNTTLEIINELGHHSPPFIAKTFFLWRKRLFCLLSSVLLSLVRIKLRFTSLNGFYDDIYTQYKKRGTRNSPLRYTRSVVLCNPNLSSRIFIKTIVGSRHAFLEILASQANLLYLIHYFISAPSHLGAFCLSIVIILFIFNLSRNVLFSKLRV